MMGIRISDVRCGNSGGKITIYIYISVHGHGLHGPNLVKYLLGNDVKITERDAVGFQPLTAAAEHNFHEVGRTILESVVPGEKEVSSILKLAMGSGDSQTVEIIERFWPRVQNFSEDCKVVPAAKRSKDSQNVKYPQLRSPCRHAH